MSSQVAKALLMMILTMKKCNILLFNANRNKEKLENLFYSKKNQLRKYIILEVKGKTDKNEPIACPLIKYNF
jgi:hypothetical protein